jgi:peptide/nickel transport system substrate-binding protein
MRKGIMVLLCVTVLLAIQCKNVNERTQKSPSTIIITGSFDNLNPLNYYPASQLLFSPLFKWDENGEVFGYLAKNWEHSSDYLTWTYTLYENIKWHDGVPFTTQDVKFTMDLLMNPDDPLIPPDAWTLKVIDKYTFSLTFNRNKKSQYNPYGHYPLPKHIYEGKSIGDIYESWGMPSQPPVGNGPYRFVRQVPETIVELEANPDHFLGKPKIDRVILKYKRGNLNELRAGNVDVIGYNPLKWETIKTSNLPFKRYYRLGTTLGCYWNQNHFLFKDVRVRRALTMAIDRRELFRLFFIPDEVPILDGFFSRHQLESSNLSEAISYNPERAKRLFEEAGWKDRNGDGVLDKDNRKFQFSILVQDGGRLKAATLIQAHYRKVGVRMEIQTFVRDVINQRFSSGDFKAIIFNVSINNTLRMIGRDPKQQGNFDIGYTGSEMISILEKYEDDWVPDWEERRNLELYEVFQKDVPVTFLHPVMHGYIAHRRIKGLSSPFRVFPANAMEYLWIEEER